MLNSNGCVEHDDYVTSGYDICEGYHSEWTYDEDGNISGFDWDETDPDFWAEWYESADEDEDWGFEFDTDEYYYYYETYSDVGSTEYDYYESYSEDDDGNTVTDSEECTIYRYYDSPEIHLSDCYSFGDDGSYEHDMDWHDRDNKIDCSYTDDGSWDGTWECDGAGDLFYYVPDVDGFLALFESVY